MDDVLKLELNRGDILVIGPIAARWLASLPIEVRDGFLASIPDVQVVIGDFAKLSRDDLIKMLENAPV